MYDFGDKLNDFLDQTGLTRAQFEQEFEAETKRHEEAGRKVAPEVVFRIIKGKYTTSRKSKAPWYEGYFIGIDSLTDYAADPYRRRMEIKDALQKAFGDKWIAEGMKRGQFNEQGKPVWDDENAKFSWQVGQVIPEHSPQRRMWAILTDEEGKKNIAVVYCAHLQVFMPVPGKIYRFRASKYKREDVWEVRTGVVSRLFDTGKTITYDEATEDCDTYINENFAYFEDVYNMNTLQVEVSPKPLNFCVNGAMLNNLSITAPDKNVDYIEVTDIARDFDDKVSMAIEKVLDLNISDGAIGILVWSPYFSNDIETGTLSRPAGRICGFIPNEQLTPTVNPKEISDIEVEENEFD